MKIELAKSAGFCFGVKRAVKMVYSALDEDKKICTLGNIIHNKNFIYELKNKGVRVINDISEVKKDEAMIIRSHGVSGDVYEKLKLKSIKFLDGTCPFVSKIHKIVGQNFINELSGDIVPKEKILVIIVGDENHPEINGIIGHCIYDYKIIADSDEMNTFLLRNEKIKNKIIKVVAQTTYTESELKKCVSIIKDNFCNYEIFDTICDETKKRQDEAKNMSKQKDIMIIIGDKSSSNTQKLVNVCKENCKTILIESAEDLHNYNLNKYKNIGVTAGASTPTDVITGAIKKIYSYI